jgi:uracil-DNA glycosylase
MIMDCQNDGLLTRIAACRLCAERFAATETAHQPRPVVRVSPSARILIAGQAPGARVHASGLPFDDPSGDRLRDWMGVDRETFYDRGRIAVVPMAFCFPGQYAQAWHLGAARAKTLTGTVRGWRAHGPALLPLPHPSWRNTAWLKKNPWFAEEILPWLRSQVARLAG